MAFKNLEEEIEYNKAWQEEYDRENHDTRRITGKFLRNNKGSSDIVALTALGAITCGLCAGFGCLIAYAAYSDPIYAYNKEKTNEFNLKISALTNEVLEYENVEIKNINENYVLVFDAKKLTPQLGKVNTTYMYKITKEQAKAIEDAKSNISMSSITKGKTERSKQAIEKYFNTIYQAIAGSEEIYSLSLPNLDGVNL